MKFDWSDFRAEDFADYCARMENDMLYEYDFIGDVRVGELCFDLVLRLKNPYDMNSSLVLTFDCYAGGVNHTAPNGEPYAWSKIDPDFPYEDIGGDDFPTSCIDMTYDSFRSFCEDQFTQYIQHSRDPVYKTGPFNFEIDLVPLAEKPLHVW